MKEPHTKIATHLKMTAQLILFIFVVMLLELHFGLDVNSYPSSQPTSNFVAPSIPVDETGRAVNTDTPPLAPSDEPALRGSESTTSSIDVNHKIEEEHRASITSSTYIFYSFIAVLSIFVGVYFLKK